jgi:PTS system ascorbate-specific IIA component
MVSILIIAHGTLGDSLIHCAGHVFGGPPAQIRQLGVNVNDDPNRLLPQVQALIGELDDGDGVLVLTDIYGATPSNLACRLIEPGRVECVAGVNLPMLVRALTYRNEPLEVVAEKALSGGRDGVVHVTKEACDVTTRYRDR